MDGQAFKVVHAYLVYFQSMLLKIVIQAQVSQFFLLGLCFLSERCSQAALIAGSVFCFAQCWLSVFESMSGRPHKRLGNWSFPCWRASQGAQLTGLPSLHAGCVLTAQNPRPTTVPCLRLPTPASEAWPRGRGAPGGQRARRQRQDPLPGQHHGGQDERCECAGAAPAL